MDTKTADAHNIQASPIDEAAARDISASCGLTALTSRVLVARGVDTPEAVHAFLAPSLERDWHEPMQIPGLVDVADQVESVMRSGGRVLVFGDFDVDGITATAVLVRGLRALGTECHGLIPHRYDEGYALSEAAVRRAMLCKPDLIVTVDCGISCGVEVEAMLAHGIAVAVTDHHEPGEHVPSGIAMADPKLVEDNPSRDLAGVGVALKLVQLLGMRFGQPDLWRDLTDFAALGTIADLMNLTGENRALVADGISRMSNNPRTCFLALAAICNVRPEEITSSKLSFTFIPRINAAGRMGDATVALDLLLSEERETAERLAGELGAVNDERRRVEAELAAQVDEVLKRDFDDEPVIVVGGEGWHEGVKGIVASRIARLYERPTIIFGIEDGVARGSGRTYGGVNLFELAGTASDLYDKFGGHAAAIGITLPAARLEELRERLCASFAEYAQAEAPQQLDSFVKLEECTLEAFDELETLQPFGNGNPVVRLAAKDVFMEQRGVVGKQGTHLRYVASDGAARVSGIYFSAPDIEALAACDQVCDIVFEPSVDEWQGRRTPKLMTRDIIVHHEQAVSSVVSEQTEELLAHYDEIVDTGDYAGIESSARFNTKVVGVTFENRQDVLAGLEAGVELALVRQPDNEMDSHAIAVTLLDGAQLGYLNRHLAKRLAPVMDAGVVYDAAVSCVTGGPDAGAPSNPRKPGPLGVRDSGVVDRSWGVNIVVRRPDLDNSDIDDGEQRRLQLARERARWESLPPAQLDDELRRALIGNHELHPAQQQALDFLAQGRSTLTVMATGRGKSLIFHLHAARTALVQGKASVFVYPLRALVADQAYHLQQTFQRFGLEVCVLTGESDADERDRIYGDLATGGVDIVLTTPEFLSIHAQRFADTGHIGFVVVDEAHHIGLARAGNRPAYASLHAALETLRRPLVLAVTATADDETCKLICSSLDICELVLDPHVRENLHIDDRRDLRDRISYLASMVAGGDKCIAYVNSREQSMQLTRELRHRLPDLAPRISFYNAGLSKSDRAAIESAFRSGDLSVVISTSAFGEGIDIPDVRHVVLFHLPFNDIEFNQMSGRAGRDGADAQVHLMYSYADARINEKILTASAPPRDQMVALYKVLKNLSRRADSKGTDGFTLTNAELAEDTAKQGRSCAMDPSAVSCGIAVFRELGFLETQGHGVARRIRMVDGPTHMELEDSTRYREGLEEVEGFASFKKWALSASADELLARFNRPILPQGPVLLDEGGV